MGGGYYNQATNDEASVCGGIDNRASGIGSFVGGGGYDGTIFSGNQASGNASVIGGGLGNTNNAKYATIGGGCYNKANNLSATVSGGYQNTASGNYATVGGGYTNTASAYATVPGGYENVASGQYSFAAGNQAQAINTGAFVWADSSTGTPLTSTNNNSVTMRASGGYRLFSSTTAGVFLAASGTSWATISDKNAKKDFAAVNPESVLDKLASIPVEQWHYKWESSNATPNIGPMAQDFKHAFYPGRDDKGITTLEFDGVELAAIQGLNQKLKTEAKTKDAEIQALKEQLDELKQTVQLLAERK